MDPNGGKKKLFNKLGREEAIFRLENESFKRITLSFYKYVIIDNVDSFRDELYAKWSELLVFGRIYVAQEGINAQMSIPEHNWSLFVDSLNAEKLLKGIPFKVAVEDDGRSFFKLTIKIRKKIVADGLSECDYDVTNVGRHLDAEQWNKAIDDGATVIDMRNHYESEIGRFKNAICPEVETFKEELPIVKDILSGKEDQPVLLYCTGGIRCEKASAYLKHHGFNDVNQLHGGIIDYVRQIKQDNSIDNKFIGKNFVFDERRGERISDDVISSCHQCGEACDLHTNCKNVNCNLLFLQCEKCKQNHLGCCSIECIEIAKMTEEKRKQLRQGVEKKTIYYTHKKVKLNLKK
jgi:UPF0176 protein